MEDKAEDSMLNVDIEELLISILGLDIKEIASEEDGMTVERGKEPAKGRGKELEEERDKTPVLAVFVGVFNITRLLTEVGTIVSEDVMEMSWFASDVSIIATAELSKIHWELL